MADFTRLNKYRAELKKMKDKRVEMDNKIRDLERKYPGLRHRIFGALCKGEIDGFKETERLPLQKGEGDEG